MGVFGNPITDETLEGLPEYEGKTIEAIDRARVALRLKNAEGKDVRALEYVENLKEKYCRQEVATLCLVYNATGGIVQYAGRQDWYGHRATDPYPIMIGNGQWGAFLHRIRTGDKNGSIGAVVYRGTNAEDKDRDWMLAWNNPFDKDKTAYTEVGVANDFNGKWAEIRDKMGNSDAYNKNESDGCLSAVAIGNDDISIFRAIMTLQNANKN